MDYGKYFEPLGDGVVASVDSLVVDYKFTPKTLQSLLNWLSNHVLWPYEFYERGGGIGKFKYCFTFQFCPQSTVTLLVGLYSPSGLSPKVRLDFNPNKVNCPGIDELILFLRMNCKQAELVRWDLAIDFPYPRRDFLLVRTDQRKRGLEETSIDNFTEYLGRRNCPGRYKLYNKTVESHLEEVLTRSELTCSGDWTPQECVDKLPALYRFEPFAADGVKQYVSGPDAFMCISIILHPEDAPYLELLDYRKRKSLRSILAKCSADSSSCHSVVDAKVVARLLVAVRKNILV